MRRPARLAVLAFLVLLVGCSGLSADPTASTPSTADRTTAPSTTTLTQNETGGGDRLAPGVTRAGVVDAETLVDAHVSATTESGYAYTFAANQTVDSELDGRTYVVNATEHVAATSGREVVSVRHVSRKAVRNDSGVVTDTTTERVDEWANDTVRLVRFERDGNITYERTEPYAVAGRTELLLRLTEALVLGQQLREFDLSVADVRGTGDDRRIVLTASGANRSRNVSAFDVRVVVDGRGRIHELAYLKVGYLDDGRRLYRETQYVLREVGVASVRRPGWVTDALDHETDESV